MLDSIMGLVTPDMKQSIASSLGGSPQGVTTGLNAATAATLGSLASRAGDSGFLGQVMNLVGSAGNQNLLGNLSSIASGNPSGSVSDLVGKFLPIAFGNSQNAVASQVAQTAGLGSGSGLGLLRIAAPLVLGYFAKMQSAGTLNASSLGNMLRAEAPNLGTYVPGSGTTRSGVDTLAAVPGRASSVIESGVSAERTASSRWLIPLAILGLLILAWLLFRALSGTHPQPVTTVTPAAPVTTAPPVVHNAAPAAWARLGEMVKVTLPDGTVLNVPQLGVEQKLINYLNDPNSTISDDQWFDFDRLLFDTGAATLQPASQEQLGNVASILKAYPKVKATIGGYTDNTGDPAANQQLSQQRADNVMAELVRLGVDPSRMTAKGYGADHPIADNSTEEGRQQNRRISLHVTEK
jgi:outer membrane protein OmpA-like peptidoglycan-associated protein